MTNKNYYTLIPAKVRYDKRLKAISKLLYGEIAALVNDKGYSWACNSYFAEIYGLSKDTISRAIRELESFGYVKCIYDKSKKNNDKRKIYLSGMNNTNNKYDSVYTENPIRYKQNCSDSIDEKLEHNNKYNTIINIKSESPSQEFDSFKEELINTFNSLTGSKANKLYQVHCFKTKFKRDELKTIFDDRKFDWRESIKQALYKVKDNDNLSSLWLDFLSCLKIYLSKGNKDNTIKRYYSKEELIERDKIIREKELIKIQREKDERERMLEEERRLGIDKMTEDEIIEFTKRNLMFLKRA